jgi:hypothetical protein
MHPTRHKDHLLVSVVFMDIIRDSQYMASVALYGLAQFLHLQRVLHRPRAFVSFLLQCEDVVFQVRVGVRLEVREKHDVVVVFERVAVSESV